MTVQASIAPAPAPFGQYGVWEAILTYSGNRTYRYCFSSRKAAVVWCERQGVAVQA